MDKRNQFVVPVFCTLVLGLFALAFAAWLRFVPHVDRSATVSIVRVSDQKLLSEWNDIKEGDWLVGKNVAIAVTHHDDRVFLKPLCKPKGGCRLDHEFTATKSETLTNQVLSYSDLANTLHNTTLEQSEMGYSSGFTIRTETVTRSIFLRVWTWDRDEQVMFPVKPKIYEEVIK